MVQATKKSESKRRRRFVRPGPAWFVPAIVAAVLGVTVYTTAFGVDDKGAIPGGLRFPLRYLEVEGEFRQVSAQQVMDVAGAYTTEGYFATDVRVIKQALQALPWVNHATVRRVWPDVLHVAITEQQAVALWGTQALVNLNGELFFPEASEFPDGLPQFDGPSNSARTLMMEFKSMSVPLESVGLRIARLKMDERRAISVALDNGVQLILGRKQGDERVARFARFYPAVQRQVGGAIKSVDLRYTNGFVVRRESGGRRRAGGALG